MRDQLFQAKAMERAYFGERLSFPSEELSENEWGIV
jgi:hypothetical protein